MDADLMTSYSCSLVLNFCRRGWARDYSIYIHALLGGGTAHTVHSLSL